MLWNRNECGKTKVMRITKQPSPIQIMLDQKQPENVEYFSCLGSMSTYNARCPREIKSGMAMAKATFSKKKKKTLVTSKLDLNLKKKLVKCYIWNIWCWNLDTSESRSEIPQSFEMWCRRRMKKVSWTNCVKNEEVLHRTRRKGISYK